MRNYQHHELIVPNTLLIEKVVTNLTLSDNLVRLVVPLVVDRAEPVKESMQRIMQTLKGQEHVYQGTEPVVVVKEVDTYYITFEVHFTIEFSDPYERIGISSRTVYSNNPLNWFRITQHLVCLRKAFPVPEKSFNCIPSCVLARYMHSFMKQFKRRKASVFISFLDRAKIRKIPMKTLMLMASVLCFSGCAESYMDKQADQVRESSQNRADVIRRDHNRSAEKVRDASGKTITGSAQSGDAEREADQIEIQGEKKADAVEQAGEAHADQIEKPR